MPMESPNATPSLTLQKIIDARLEDISNKLGDPVQLPTIHPLIYQIQVTARNKEGDREVFSFDVRERVPLLGLSIPNQYKGQLRRDLSAPGVVVMEGWSQPGIHLFIRFTIEELSPTQCKVTDSVWIKAPWLLRSFMVKTVTAAHQAQLEKLAASFAAKT
jgi:hypothetical protein